MDKDHQAEICQLQEDVREKQEALDRMQAQLDAVHGVGSRNCRTPPCRADPTTPIGRPSLSHIVPAGVSPTARDKPGRKVQMLERLKEENARLRREANILRSRLQVAEKDSSPSQLTGRNIRKVRAR